MFIYTSLFICQRTRNTMWWCEPTNSRYSNYGRLRFQLQAWELVKLKCEKYAHHKTTFKTQFRYNFDFHNFYESTGTVLTYIPVLDYIYLQFGFGYKPKREVRHQIGKKSSGSATLDNLKTITKCSFAPTVTNSCCIDPSHSLPACQIL